MLSLVKMNGFPRGRKDKERYSSQRKEHAQRYRAMEMHGILRCLCVARAYAV